MNKRTLFHFFEGKASREEREKIKAWVEASPENREQLLKDRAFYDAMILADEQPVTSHPSSKGFTAWSFMKEVIKIAAVIVLVAGAGLYYHREKIKEAGSAMHTLFVPAGQRANLTLPDGTNVWLSARTEIKYPAFFNGSARKIELNGEAYFDVNKQHKNPFIIKTKQCNIEVLGTRFYVEAYDNSDVFSTALMDGSVKITHWNQSSVTLKPNQKADLKDGCLAVSPIVDYDPYRWRDGLICFKDIRFTELMKKFEKYYGIDIVIENPKLSDHVFSGKFRISDGVDNALRVLQKDAKYTFKRNCENSVIYIK